MNNIIIVYGSPKQQEDVYNVLTSSYGVVEDFKGGFRAGELGICLLLRPEGIEFVRTYGSATEPAVRSGTHPNSYLWDLLLPRYLPRELLTRLRVMSDRYAKAFYRRRAQLSIGMNSLFDDEV